MKKRYWAIPAGMLLGGAAGLIQGLGKGNILTLLLKPFTALGILLRSWSLSGAGGNIAAWAVLIALSLLPVLYILIARRKRKQQSDWLFLLTSAGLFGGLFLLVNPTLYVHPAMTEALSISPELLTGGPVFMMLSMLLLSVVARWSGGLMRLKKQDQRLIFWTQAILVCSMALISFSFGGVLANAVLSFRGTSSPYAGSMMEFETAVSSGAGGGSDALSAWMNAQTSDMPTFLSGAGSLTETSALIGLMLSLAALIPDLFSLWLLDAAMSLVGAMGQGMFSEEADACASVLAVRARYTMIAAVACMALENLLTVLLAQWILNWNMNFFLPLDDLLLSCGAMLLARLLSAACKVKRDNDLMI